MNDRTIVQHPNGYSGVLMGKSTMMIYDKDDNCIVHTCFRTPNTEKELYDVLETMPRFIEILASVEADRKTEPQTDCGDFADRLAYERGVKHAWEVAQKVFDSTVTFYEAEDVAKQIAKDEPQTCNDCDLERCETCVTEIGKDEQTE